MSNKLSEFLATFFYIGYFPLAPGSVASVAGALLALWLQPFPVVYIGVFVLITVVGFFAGGQVEKFKNDKDPSCVVIDEVSGAMIAFFMLPNDPVVLVTAYFLFRAFDMFKIYPGNKLENCGGSLGIMADDLVAGLYTNVIMHAALALIR